MSTEILELGSNLGLTNTSEYPRVIRRDLAHPKSGKPRVVAWIGYKIEKAVDAACLAAGFVPRIACISGSAQGMQELVAAGLGIALLPRLAIHPPPGATVIELAAPRPTRTLVAVWRSDRLSHAATAFLHQLTDWT